MATLTTFYSGVNGCYNLTDFRTKLFLLFKTIILKLKTCVLSTNNEADPGVCIKHPKEVNYSVLSQQRVLMLACLTGSTTEVAKMEDIVLIWIFLYLIDVH